MSELSRQELEQRIRQLEDRIAKLEQGAQSQQDIEGLGRFAGSIAHDLNNLLVGILGNAGLALMDLSTFSPCRPLIQEVETSAQRAAELTNRMLAFTGNDPPAAESPDDVANGHPETTAWRGKGLVLVVDDEMTVRSLARRVLEKFGFRVMTADDGLKALEIFRPHATEFVVVLLDVTMPNLDGAETFLEMRRLRPDVKVILSSGYDQREAMRKIAQEELAGFLHKPYLPMDLVDRVREALEGAPKTRTSGSDLRPNPSS